MIKKTNVNKDLYVSLNGTVVTAIQTLGYGDNSYDHITRRVFDTEDEANNFYERLGGK